MNFAENFNNKQDLEKDAQKAANEFKEIAENAAMKGQFKRRVPFYYYNTPEDRERAYNIVRRCVSILEEDFGFTVEQGSPRQIGSYGTTYVIPITLYW